MLLATSVVLTFNGPGPRASRRVNPSKIFHWNEALFQQSGKHFFVPQAMDCQLVQCPVLNGD